MNQNFLEYIQFVGNENLEPINCTAIDHNNNLVTIIFNNNRPNDNSVITSGYRLLNPCESFEDMTGDIYLSYTTLYRDIDENTVILSNDGSVYVEPEPLEPYIPTEDELAEQERQSNIQSLKSQISELKTQLASTDYIFVKCYEASLVDKTIDEYDFETLHAERQSLREQINQLETELSALESE